MVKQFVLSLLLATVVLCSAGIALAQTVAPGQQEIRQAIIVNGQQADGVTVVQNGAVRNYTCPSPQEYVAADQSSSGWACFDQATGTWLLNAQPQQAASVYERPPAYYPAAPVYGYYGDPYPYPSGVYPYPYYGGPAFAFGFGFGYGHENHIRPYGRGGYGSGHFGGSFEHGRSGPGGHGNFSHGGAHGGGGHAEGRRR